MAIKIAAWNVEGRLHGYQKSGRGTAAHILREIKLLDADVLVLPEFYMDQLAPGVKNQLKDFGYEILETAYSDVERTEYEREKWGEVHIGVLSRLPISNVKIIRPGAIRNLIVCQVQDPKSRKTVRIIATHLDDRSEAMRMKQVKDLVKIINETEMPTIMLGDFNAMWPSGRARLLRSWPMRLFTKIMPRGEFRFVARRVFEMAEGTALGMLAAHTNLREADLHRRPTTTPKMRFTPFFPSVRLIQIDHMLISPEVKTSDFKIAKDGGSDHRAISAIISPR